MPQMWYALAVAASAAYKKHSDREKESALKKQSQAQAANIAANNAYGGGGTGSGMSQAQAANIIGGVGDYSNQQQDVAQLLGKSNSGVQQPVQRRQSDNSQLMKWNQNRSGRQV